MQIPETPSRIEDLDLIRRLKAYSDGSCSWNDAPIGPNAQRSCTALHSDLVRLDAVIAPMLDKITAREMDTFTMHDRNHALKVAHLMWYILTPPRRERLTAPEIGLLVCSAYLHDLGMFLSKEERAERLDPASDLWERLEIDEYTKQTIERLRAATRDDTLPEVQHLRAVRRLQDAEEALLCQDTRERHATRERYLAILERLRELHRKDPARMPNPDACMSFAGDLFVEPLVDICISHNEDAAALARPDSRNPELLRFPRDFPIGPATADLQLVAAALRLADILDFDRERTPPVLYHYFLPGPLDPATNRSALEWGKHLAISNWHIADDAVVFRGSCESHIIHHAVVQFCDLIANEIQSTRATFSALREADWPFRLPTLAKAEIHPVGYRYVPYKFELDDERIYQLLMGGQIYEEPIAAVRELLQNAVDACKLRDQQTRLYEPSIQPGTDHRIVVRYEEPKPTEAFPRLTVQDTGTGMDALVIEQFFLRVGRSYYRSAEFNRIRAELRKQNLDFAPVAEFGIGFLSSFLIADRVEVETAMYESARDTRKRVLDIHGPTRLIRITESENAGPRRFKGTRVSLTLVRGHSGDRVRTPLTWEEIRAYLHEVCVDLPYTVHLQHVRADGGVEEEAIKPQSRLVVEFDDDLEPMRIPVNDPQAGLEGEIAVVSLLTAEGERREINRRRVEVTDREPRTITRQFPGGGISMGPEDLESSLLRGGFRVGEVPGLPDARASDNDLVARAKIRMTWHNNQNKHYAQTTLARNAVADEWAIGTNVARIWLSHLLRHVDRVPLGQILGATNSWLRVAACTWLEEFNAYTLYQLAAKAWHKAIIMEDSFRWASDESETHRLFGPEKDERAALIPAWESGAGPPLPFARHSRGDVSTQLLRAVLPLVCDAIAGPYGLSVMPPVQNWREILTTNREFIRNPKRWGPFLPFTATIRELVYLDNSTDMILNAQFRDRILDVFGLTELPELMESLSYLERLEWKRNDRTIRIAPRVLEVLKLAQLKLGDLKIGRRSESARRIDSYVLP